MSGNTEIIIAIPPESFHGNQTGPELPEGYSAAYMIYEIGRGFKLFRSKYAKTHGGYMVLDTSGFRGGGPISAPVTEVIAECESSGRRGIVIDAGDIKSPAQLSLSKALAAAAHERGLPYFVPESLADSGFSSIVRIPTALSGGTLKRHLSDALKKYGVARVAAEIERVRMDFTLPARSGIGKELSGDALKTLITQYGAHTHFSLDLAVKYFNYYDKKNAHFVLYDDESTIRRKLALADSMGIKHAFLFYPNVRDLLFPQEK